MKIQLRLFCVMLIGFAWGWAMALLFPAPLCFVLVVLGGAVIGIMAAAIESYL